MPFVKLDTKILDSSLWVDRDLREVFITALLMARPLDVTKPLETYKIREIEKTDFVVPPAEDYGFVAAAGSGIVRRSLVDMESGMKALEALADPDPESRTSDFEGRRLVRVNGGFIVLNFKKYRDLDHSTDRVRRFREREEARLLAGQDKRDRANKTLHPVSGTNGTPLPTQAEADSDADTEAAAGAFDPEVEALIQDAEATGLYVNPRQEFTSIQNSLGRLTLTVAKRVIKKNPLMLRQAIPASPTLEDTLTPSKKRGKIQPW